MTKSLRLQDILVYPLKRYIPPVAKVNDVDEATVATELHEYVVTRPIEDALVDFLEAYAESRTRTTDRIGVWISGFFGSGKSHFAKVLSYLLENRTVHGQSARSIFAERLGESPRRPEIEGLLHRAGLLKSHVIMFNIKTEEDQHGEDGDSISQIIYRRYLASRGLSTNPVVAQLELSLMERGLYEDFKSEVVARQGRPWEEEREDFLFIRPTVATALQTVAPQDYPNREEAMEALAFVEESQRLTVSDLVKRLAAYIEQLEAEGDGERPPRLVFIIDEMGQFVGDDGQRLLELQSIAEEFGTQGHGRLWLIVTAQAKLNQLISGVEAVNEEFGKIGARFDTGLTLTSDDVEQVLHGRILQKKEAYLPEIHDFYHHHEGTLTLLAELPGSSRREWPGMTSENFTASAPFLPYHPTLIQAIFSNLPNAMATGFQISDEARSMIGMAQGVLSTPENGFIGGELGQTVTLAMVYDQIAVDLLPQDRREITNLPKQMPDYQPLDNRILKALYLLQTVPWIAVTAATLAHALIRDVRTERIEGLEARVEMRLKRLKDAHYVIPKDDGAWEFLTGTKKTFEEDVAGVKVRELELRREVRSALKEVLRSVGKLNYRHGMRAFDVTVRGDEEEFSTGEGLVLEVYSPLHVERHAEFSVDDLEQILSFSHPETVYWIAAESPELVAHLQRAIRLDTVLGEWRTKQAKTEEEREILREKETELHALENKIQTALRVALTNGTLVWNGRAEELDGRTTTLNPIFNRALSQVVPHVYPKFELAAVKPNEKDIEAVLTVMPEALESVGATLNLFDAQGHLNQHSAVVAEVRRALEQRVRRGQETDGKSLENHFTGGDYGWHPVIVRLTLAALFRAGMVSVQADNVHYHDPSVPGAQACFTHVRRFRRAVFFYEQEEAVTPAQLRRAQEELKVIFDAPQREETANVLAEQIMNQMETWYDHADRLMMQLQGAGYPIPSVIQKSRDLYQAISSHQHNPGKVVKQFLAHLDEIRAWHAEAQVLYRFVLQEKRLPRYTQARQLLNAVAQAESTPGTELLYDEEAARWRTQLQTWVETGTVHHHTEAFIEYLNLLRDRYQEVYGALHARRAEAVTEGYAELEAHDIPKDQHLARFTCADLHWDDKGLHCAHCHMSLGHIYDQVGTVANVVQEIIGTYRPKPKKKGICRLQVAQILPQRRFSDVQALDAALRVLHDAVAQILAEDDVDTVEIA
jgi:hypothetical protein